MCVPLSRREVRRSRGGLQRGCLGGPLWRGVAFIFTEALLQRREEWLNEHEIFLCMQRRRMVRALQIDVDMKRMDEARVVRLDLSNVVRWGRLGLPRQRRNTVLLAYLALRAREVQAAQGPFRTALKVNNQVSGAGRHCYDNYRYEAVSPRDTITASRTMIREISFNFRYITRISSPRCKGFLMRKIFVSLWSYNNHEAAPVPPPYCHPQARPAPNKKCKPRIRPPARKGRRAVSVDARGGMIAVPNAEVKV